MVYFMMVYQIWPGKVKEYEEIHKREGIPVLKKHGVKVLGVWKNWVGGETFEFIRIHVFEDLADFQKKDTDLHNDPEYQRYLERIGPLHMGRTTRLLQPTEYSPLQ